MVDLRIESLLLLEKMISSKARFPSYYGTKVMLKWLKGVPRSKAVIVCVGTLPSNRNEMSVCAGVWYWVGVTPGAMDLKENCGCNEEASW